MPRAGGRWKKSKHTHTTSPIQKWGLSDLVIGCHPLVRLPDLMSLATIGRFAVFFNGTALTIKVDGGKAVVGCCQFVSSESICQWPARPQDILGRIAY